MEEERGLGSRLERLNWPGLAISALLGLFVIFLVALFGFQGAGLLGRLTGEETVTPTPGQVSQATGTPPACLAWCW